RRPRSGARRTRSPPAAPSPHRADGSARRTRRGRADASWSPAVPDREARRYAASRRRSQRGGLPGSPCSPSMKRDAAPLSVIAKEWLRIGLIGFGGPPAHITLLRELVVRREGWMDARAFEDANAACSLLPGPSSTQLSIFCAYRVAGPAGAVIVGLGFVVP